ncbi:HU domain-containing protein [Mesonia maritima]|uniref:Nucleoid DNA-binding protein/cell division protein FtsN n=1 Tax=Mesonia maritima TaxID=1793873 RepID=A0ABU1K330_9FLAO|nr:SPOR domain-containing protein [Mesonia maritima]MDR6299721.1 nucleoid DNA-binding protein/cell division protein FtsN [Mesonia maritima]
MRIENYIKDLLYRHECVVIPDFGAFLTQRKPAQIHETTHAFYPPKKHLGFNNKLTENDGILINYLSKAEEISYQEAMQQVASFVAQLKTSLREIGKIEFEAIGTFYLEKEEIIFQPSYHHNYLLEAFGTEMYTASKIERSVKTAEEKPAETVSTKVEEKEIPVKKLPEEKRTIPIWRYAAVGIIAIGVSGLVAANWYSNDVKNHNLAEQQKAEKKVEQTIQQATFAIDNPLPEVTFKVHTQKGNYHIVAGAFRLKENAEKKLKQLREQGFPAREIGVNKYGLHQVIYNTFESRTEALQALRTIKNQENQNAWLLVKSLEANSQNHEK